MKPKNFPGRKKKRQLIANKQDLKVCESEIIGERGRRTKKQRVKKEK